MQRQLPAPFRPKRHDRNAVAGICLIRLENIRPRRFPSLLGLSSENKGHRIAVVWDDDTGCHEGVYIPRRDTGSLVNHLAGGRLFPVEHQRATFQVTEDERRITVHRRSADAQVEIDIASQTASVLPEDSIFRSVGDASAFFESGGVGYSVTASVLRTDSWNVEPLALDRAYSSFENAALFPPGSIRFDCALIMRNIHHEWETAADMYL